MRYCKLACIMLTSTIITTAQSAVIIIHGSFATHFSWHKPGGDFFEAVKQQANELGLTTYSFGWAGIPSYPKVLYAALELAQLIIAHPNEQHILIGHSYGGNVINLASQLLNPSPFAPMPYLLKIAQTVQDFSALTAVTSKEALALCQQQVTISRYEEEEKAATHDPIFTAACKSTQKLITRKEPLAPCLLSKKSIACAFLLGTPALPGLYSPCMESIGTLCNLYSHGDAVQLVGGLSGRTLYQKKNLYNFAVNVEFEAGMLTNPGHSDLHHPTLGRWLLYVLTLLDQTKDTEKQTLQFSCNAPPHVISHEPIKQRPTWFF